MKNKRDRLFFTQLFVPQASQSSYGSYAIFSAQSACGMEIRMSKLTVVGMGPGSQSCLTLEALEALRKADLIVGAGRLLETLPEECSKNRKTAVSAQAVCDAVYGSDSSFPCVVCTGDTGCYSLCTGLGKYWD